jgi:hypothetical protein
MRYLLLAIAYFIVLNSGCNREKESTEINSVRTPISGKQRNEDAIFALRVEKADSYSVGKEASFFVVLSPKGEYHINQEYPTSIALNSSAELSFKKNKLLKPDATRFDEKLAKFELPFSAVKNGDFPLEVKASFAMCTAETCIPFDKTLALSLSIK